MTSLTCDLGFGHPSRVSAKERDFSKESRAGSDAHRLGHTFTDGLARAQRGAVRAGRWSRSSAG